MANLNKLPQYNQPLIVGDMTSRDWYFFFAGLWKGIPPEMESPVTVGASPFVYSAPSGGSLIVSGGTVSQIRFSRDGTTYYDTGAVEGMFAISASDLIEITYSVLPTVVFVPT